MPTETDTAQQRQRNPSTIKNVNNVATYKTPMLAVLNGRPVKLTAYGDAPGHSPVFQFINEQGHVDWVEAERVTVIDPFFLPPSQSSLRSINALMDTGTTSNR